MKYRDKKTHKVVAAKRVEELRLVGEQIANIGDYIVNGKLVRMEQFLEKYEEA